MKDRFTNKSPFQKMFLFVFAFITSISMAVNPNTNRLNVSSTDSYSSDASYVIDCTAEAGTMSTSSPLTDLVDGSATITATTDGNAVVPEGYTNLYVLTKGQGLVIMNAGPEPSFEVSEPGFYTIHSLVFNADTLDLNIVQFGTTTGFDVFGLLLDGGGKICASLDVAGAQFKVFEEECTADAGTMSTEMPNVELSNGSATISAMAAGDAIVPEGFTNLYVLTQGEELVILNAGAEPTFEVTEAGLYTIHSLVFNPATLDLNIVQFGTTTGFDVFGLLEAGGGKICASLDVPGAAFKVSEEECTADAGTMSTEMPNVELSNGSATISAMAAGDAIVPEGFTNLYVLTQGEELVILNAGAEPTFEVTEAGLYTIHSLVFNPATLDLNIVQFGTTTGFDVFGLLIAGGGDICASLDVPGAAFKVSEEECTADAGTMSTEMPNVRIEGGTATLTASADGNAVIPDGYAQAFVLTQGEGLVILNYGFEPTFDVTEAGTYTIHSLVLDPNTLDVTIIEPGVTTGFDVFGLLIAGGGDICASLDVPGAGFEVKEECLADAGTMSTEMPNVRIEEGTATLTASADGNAVIPDGYAQAFVLTQGEGLVILNYGFEPTFDVTEAGTYTIHSLVLDPNTLDVTIIEPGVTTGFDVFGLLIAGGGDICASLDVPGAGFEVKEECLADAGTMSTEMPNVRIEEGTATLTASADGNAVIPDGYAQAFVLTQGEGLIILNYGFEPTFDVTEAGTYTIHSLVLDPNTLDVTIIEPGVTTGFDVFGLLIAGGGDICASLDVPGAGFEVKEECLADAGTMSTEMPNVRIEEGTATLTASADGNAVIPDGYAQAFVLTQGEGLVILNYGFEPTFDVTEAGTYTIHSLVLDPNTLDVTIIEPGVTTGFDVFGLLIAGGGDICASLDVPGAGFEVKEECLADAGTMSTEMPNVRIEEGTATLTASADGNAVIPDGYAQAFVLTQGEGLVILNYGFEPTFDVTEAGTYTIHSLVLDPNTLDVTIIEPGVTTGFDVFGLLIAGGGDICASLDVPGAGFEVKEECLADAGTMSTEMPNVRIEEGTATLTASADGNAVIPDGYAQAFVLTQGEGLVILNYGFEPTFDVTEAGTYTIHSLVLDPNTLDVTIIEPGVTTGFDVFGLLIAGGGDICASLDVPGAGFEVKEECLADAGTMSTEMPNVELSNGTAIITASANGDAIVPEGYVNIYVLTQGEELVILNAGAEPSFEVTAAGDYTIHSLVFNPATLDLNIVQFGTTTGFDVFGLLIAGGGEICASLDVKGAAFKVSEEKCTADAGTMHAEHPIACLDNGAAMISAEIGNAPVIPTGYQQIFVLTRGLSLTIVDASASPEFTVNHPGFYRIHSLVYNPETLDLGIVQFGTTTGFDVLHLVAQNNICASLDVHGALNLVTPSWVCHFFNNFRIGDETALIESYMEEFGNYQAFENSFKKDNLDIKIYPNPTASSVSLDAELVPQETINYTVVDVSGRVMLTGQKTAFERGNMSIDLSRLRDGTYFVKFESTYRNFTKAVQVKR